MSRLSGLVASAHGHGRQGARDDPELLAKRVAYSQRDAVLSEINGDARSDAIKERGEDGSLVLYKQVNELTRRPDERKLVLGAIKRIRHPDALAIAEAALAEEALRRDAENACLDLAQHLVHRDEHREHCLALLKQIADTSTDGKHKKRATEILAKNSKP